MYIYIYMYIYTHSCVLNHQVGFSDPKKERQNMYIYIHLYIYIFIYSWAGRYVYIPGLYLVYSAEEDIDI